MRIRRFGRSLVLLLFASCLAAPALHAQEVTMASVGGGGYGEPAVLEGVWVFDLLSPAQRQTPANCENTAYNPPGDILANSGWQPSPQSTVPPRIERLNPAWIDSTAWPGSRPSLDVAGGVLAYYNPQVGGFAPGQFGYMESPVIDFASLGLTVHHLDVTFSANSNLNPLLQQLSFSVGFRRIQNGVWTPWTYQQIPVQLGPAEYRVPVVAGDTVQVIQVQLGVFNWGANIILDPGPALDHVQFDTKALPADPTWKYVPDIAQGIGGFCQASAYADCLTYWASNGYPELLPAEGTMEEKEKKLQDDLKAAVHTSGRGNFGLMDYLVKKGVYAGQPQNPPTRQPLEMVGGFAVEHSAKWEWFSREFALCHDMIIGIQWCNAAGLPVNADAAHYLTVAGMVTKPDGKIVLKVANPWGDSHSEVNEGSRDKAYDTMDVTINADGSFKLNNNELETNSAEEMVGVDHLCVRDIMDVRPKARGDAGERVISAGSSRATSSITYAYSLDNPDPYLVDAFAMALEMPYTNVQAPPGWTWLPLPANYPHMTGCGAMLGPAGILWSTETNPVPPGGSLSGFSFDVDASYPAMDEGPRWYINSRETQANFGFVWGPALPGVSEVGPVGPPSAELFHLYSSPNPAHSAVEIHFLARSSGISRLRFFDAMGRLVRTIPSEGAGGEERQVRWDRTDDGGRRLPAGIYLYQLESGSTRLSRRIVLVH